MISYTTVHKGQKDRKDVLEARLDISYGEAHEVFLKLYKHYDYHFLLESKQVSLFSGRFSLIGIDPAIKLTGKDDSFQLQALNKRGEEMLEELFEPLEAYVGHHQENIRLPLGNSHEVEGES